MTLFQICATPVQRTHDTRLYTQAHKPTCSSSARSLTLERAKRAIRHNWRAGVHYKRVVHADRCLQGLCCTSLKSVPACLLGRDPAAQASLLDRLSTTLSVWPCLDPSPRDSIPPCFRTPLAQSKSRFRCTQAWVPYLPLLREDGNFDALAVCYMMSFFVIVNWIFMQAQSSFRVDENEDVWFQF